MFFKTSTPGYHGVGSLALLDANSSLFLHYLLFYGFCRNRRVVPFCLHLEGAAFKFVSKAFWKEFGGELVARSLLPVTAVLSSTGIPFGGDPEEAQECRLPVTNGPGHREVLERDNIGMNEERFVF